MVAFSPNPVDVHVGSKLRLRRQMLQLSQTAIGDALGITFQQIQKYERGMTRISASRLQMLSGLLNVPVSYFFENGGDLPPAVASSGPARLADDFMQFISTKDGFQLNEAFIGIKDAETRTMVIELINAVAGDS